MTENPLGMRQDVIMQYLLMLAIEKNLTFPMLKDLIDNPFFLEAMVSNCSLKDVRDYFRLRFKRENKSSLDSLLSRIDRLLFLDNSRLMLSARGCLDFNELLTDKITIVNLGSAPFGYEDFAKFWGTFILTKIIRAIFQRPIDENTLPAWICIDEWQNLLTPEQADQMEKTLSMARFKRCCFTLICQQMGQVAKVSRSLPKITLTNTNKHYFFRSNYEDAKYFSYALPVTGKMVKPKKNVWDRGEKIEYCSHAEEIRALIEQVTQLPNRYFYYLDKTKPYKAQLVKSVNLDIREAKLKADKSDEQIKNLLQKGSLCQPVSLLKEVLEVRKKGMQSMCNMQPFDGDERKRKQMSSYIEPPASSNRDKAKKRGPRVNLG
jgi:hypothetical protein